MRNGPEKHRKTLLSIHEDFFQLDKQNKLARIDLAFDNPSDVFSQTVHAGIPVLSDEFLAWLLDAFDYIPDKYRQISRQWTGGLPMKYTPAERLAIGKLIYENELNRYQAAIEYGISEQTARNYMRMYRNAHGLLPKNRCGGIIRDEEAPEPIKPDPALEEYETMTKDEPIRELVRSKIREARLRAST